MNHVAAAQPQDEERSEAEKQRHARIEHALQPDQDAVAIDVLLVRAAEPLQFVRFLGVGADDPHARQRLLHHRRHFRQLRLDGFEATVDRAPEVAHRERDERQRHQRNQRQPRVDRQHQHDGDHEHEDGVRGVHHRGTDHHADGVQVVGRARHEVAGAPRLVEAEREPLELREEIIADVVLDPARRADEDPAHEEQERAAHDRDPEDQQRIEGELLPRDAGVQVVDRVLQHPRRQQLNG